MKAQAYLDAIKLKLTTSPIINEAPLVQEVFDSNWNAPLGP
jgi:hypothetical protein